MGFPWVGWNEERMSHPLGAHIKHSSVCVSFCGPACAPPCRSVYGPVYGWCVPVIWTFTWNMWETVFPSI